MDRRLIFLQAIKGTDGQVNVGYLVLLRLLQMLGGVLLVMCALAGWAMWLDSKRGVEIISALGPAIGYAGGGMFGTALAACGVFLWGDSRAAPQATTTTTTTTAVPIVPVIAPVDGTKTLAPQIEQADVGKSVVIEPTGAAAKIAALKAKKGK